MTHFFPFSTLISLEMLTTACCCPRSCWHAVVRCSPQLLAGPVPSFANTPTEILRRDFNEGIKLRGAIPGSSTTFRRTRRPSKKKSAPTKCIASLISFQRFQTFQNVCVTATTTAARTYPRAAVAAGKGRKNSELISRCDVCLAVSHRDEHRQLICPSTALPTSTEFAALWSGQRK